MRLFSYKIVGVKCIAVDMVHDTNFVSVKSVVIKENQQDVALF